MIYSLITNHTPEEINIYIMDFGSGTLGSFKNAPQVGDFILPSEEDKILNIFKMLDAELERRKKLFVNFNGDFQNYITRSGNTVPYILLFINNYDVFQDSFDFEEMINKITRECSKYGIMLIASINSTSGMRYKLRQNFKSDITLQFNDQDDYSMIIGNTRKLYPSEIYGRGLVKLDNVYEFQTAHIFQDDEINDKLPIVIDELNKKYQEKATHIPVVPEVVLIDDLVGLLKDTRIVPIGINKDTIEPEIFNFKDNYGTIVSSNDDDGMIISFTTALTKMLSKIPNNNLVMLDGDGNYQNEYENVNYVNDNFDEMINKICDSMEYQYKQYVNDGYSNKNLKSTKNSTIILASFTRVIARLNEEIKKRFLDDLAKVKDTNQFDFIIVDRVDNLKKLEYDEWYKKVIQNNYGIWLGNGIADQTLIKTNIGFKKDNNEIPFGFGVVVRNSKTSLVKLITDTNYETLENGDDKL